MARVERFFHVRTGYPHGGATIRVTGDTEILGQVDVQTTFCSKKDVFCKKEGRDRAIKSPIKVVPLRYLPSELVRIAETAVKKNKRPELMGMFDYTFAIKYFLPKE